jgi:large subunit ribosomal protein L21
MRSSAGRPTGPPLRGDPKPATPMYAIVEVGGKQFKVQSNTKLYVPQTKDDVGASITLDRVLLVGGGDAIHVGAPTVEGASVAATVLGHVKADKVIVFKKKRRKGYRVKNGHRQPYTQLAIGEISLGDRKN